MTRAESIALALVTALAGAAIVPYLLDCVGLGVMPQSTAVAAAAGAVAVLLGSKPKKSPRGDLATFAASVAIAFATLLWLARPEWLPPGSGPDLTHHVLLVDYIQMHGTLVHDPDAGAAIGEMAAYTPGLHVLTVVAGSIAHVDPFLALYPVVAFAIALKFGVFALCLLRLLPQGPSRLPLAIAGVATLFLLSLYTLGSVVTDSFLAQAVAELFAVTMWWALILWDETPGWQPIFVFGLTGAATFLTWPVWIGALVLTLAAVLAVRTDVDGRRRMTYAAAALAPIAIVAAIHVFNHPTGLGLAATSGAVSVPRLRALGWSMPVAVAALAISSRSRARRPVLAFAVALVAQALALWWVAQQRGASTPYMALKMMYLAIYPIVAAGVVAVSPVLRSRLSSSAIALLCVLAAGRHIALLPRVTPTVSRELWDAARWVRDRAPANCVDYLVGNEYTAYWLHLAVLRNPRADARSTNSGTYETQASFARWLVDTGGARYAIARLSIVPREIRDRVHVAYRSGDAAVLSRAGACSAAARGD
jgi:hypothetical protein